ncbi:hypothetical protein C8R45DRAFT_779465, partial [Mycena sanguinolenta]
PIWVALVRQWCRLEELTAFQTAGKALSAQGRPEAVGWWVQRARKARALPPGLDEPDAREDFYESVVRWWISVNPGWRKEGVAEPGDFMACGLKQQAGDLDGLPAGLNGLTSVIACLWWWYRAAGSVEGTPLWRKMVQDIHWVLQVKERVM